VDRGDGAAFEQGGDLANYLGESNLVLMRDRGFAPPAHMYLSQGEIDARNRGYSPYSTETLRAWEYWANKAGCGHMLTRPDDERTGALRS
jgi:hypothetical protein